MKVGDKAEIKKIITEQDIIDFSKVSGDYNPVHLNEEFANESIFRKKVAHGFLIGSYISATIGKVLPGEGTIYLSQSLYFKSPVFIDDEITISIEVTDMPASNRALLKTICVNREGVTVIAGEALVIPPKGKYQDRK